MNGRWSKVLAGWAASWLTAVIAACGPVADADAWRPLAGTLDISKFETGEPQTEAEAENLVTLSLAEAQARLPFVLSLPTWTPAGFELQAEVELFLPAASAKYTGVSLTWMNAAAEEMIFLQASTIPAAGPHVAGRGREEPMKIGGRPATLRQWGMAPAEHMTLKWEQDGVNYTLTAAAVSVPLAELVRMAESVR